MKKHITIAALLVAGTAFANAEEWTLLDLPDAQAAENGGWASYGGTALAVMNNTKDKDYGIYVGNNGGKVTMTGTNSGDEGYWDGEKIVLFGRGGAGGESFSLVLGEELTEGYSLEKIKFTADISNIDAEQLTQGDLEFDFGISVWNSEGDTITNVGTVTKAETGSLTEGFSVDLVLELTVPFTWGTDDKIIVTVNGPSYKPATAPYTVSNITVGVVPEPSAFGLLAGIGALALVASRRRRK